MDYDDNDFQSQNLHLAGEGSNKFPPVLQPYALPKFDFDDNLHGPLRFDSLVETEVFLGIESNEDSQWIEEFSRGSSGIQFSSSAAETCSISRRNNVWSEATSSESVEMLLKSVGQEELIPAQTNIRESDACDELGFIIKQMEPSLKQDSNIPAKVVDVTNLQSTSLPDELAENFPVLDDDGGGQQPQVEDGSQTYEGGASVGQGLGDLTAISVDVRLPIAEGSPSIDDKCNDVNQREVDTVVNESLDNRTQEGATSEVQVSAVAGVQNIVTGNDRFNNEDASNNVNVSIHENIDASEIDKGERQEKGDVLSREVQTQAQLLNAEMVEKRAPYLENTLLMASGKSVESSTVKTNLGSVEEPYMIPKGNSGLEMSDQSGVDAHKASLVVVEGNTTVERHEVQSSNRSQLDSENLVTKSGASLLSTEGNVASGDKVDGSCSTYGAVNSSLPEVCSSSEFISETHTKDHVSLPSVVESIEMCETSVVPRKGDVEKCEKDVPVVEQKESLELPSDGSNMDKIIDKGVGTSSFTEGSTENELIVLKPQADSTAGSESVDGVPVSSGNGIAEDAVIAHKDVEVPPAPTVFSCSDKEKENAAKIPTEASFSDHKVSCEAKTGVDPVSEPEEASSGTAVQMLCKSVDHSVLAADACNVESRVGPEVVVIEKVSQVCLKDKEVCTALCDSTANKGDCTEALIKENGEKEPKKVSEVNNVMPTPVPSAMEVSCQDSHQKVQEENTVVVSGDTNFQQIAVPNTNAVEHENKADLDKRGNSPTVIKATELSHDASNKDGLKSSSDHSVSVSKGTDGNAIKGQSASKDPNQIEASKDDSSFTFEVSPLADLPRKDAKKWQPFSNIVASTVSPIVDGSTSSSRLGQLDPKISQDLSHGSPKLSEVAIARSGSKGNSERKPRRSLGKSTAKEKAKKGNPIKESASVRLERGDKTTNVSLSPSGVSQLVQSNEIQRYGHVDSSSVKPFVLATSTSGLPDLNSSVSPAAVFQQPFTDLQQVQLRAQIFVYGALIQGTAPDEAYMISAFGGPDGGRSIWENAWRSCIERLHGQKSHLITPETPLQSRPGARATEQSIKQSALQSKVVSSPASRGSSKGTPTIVNSIVPFSSPLWSMSTPGDTLQSSGMPRGPVMDYQRALSPLHPHQTPAIRNFVGHSPSWLSQAPFGGPWVASQNSALDTSGRFSVQLPITETVQLTPVKESSAPHSSVAKPSGPVGQSGASASVLPGTSSVLDVKMVTASASQTSADPKPRKRKKTSVSENPGQNILPPQPQIESVIASATPVSTSIAITTPVGFVSKAPTEKFITSVTTTSSMDLRKEDQNAEPKAVISEDTLGKVKEARVQAEDAAALAASAVSHSQEIWDQLDKQRNSGLQPDVETKLASAAVAIAAAAAVAKAAAAAAKVASDAALQAKLMAEEVFSSGYSNPCQINATSLSDGMKNLGKATPASILKVDDGTNSSSSILVAAREAARRRVEAASAASKRAENMDAIVKAAELAAEAVFQAGKIVAMGDPFPLSELVAAGPGGYWKVSQVTSELVSKSNQIGREHVNVDSGGKGPDTSARQLKEVLSDKKENLISNAAKSPTSTERTIEDHGRLVDGLSGTGATTIKDAKGQKGRKASDLAKTIGVVPESENGSRSSTVQNEFEKAETSKENSIKEGSLVEVFKEGSGFKASWFSAKVLSLKDGKAYVRYTELALGEGSGKLEEWVPLEGEGDKAPKIRVCRPSPAMPFEGTKKRRRAALGEYNWSVGDRVDAWIQDSWWEGVITEKSKKDEAITVNFPAQGETSVFKAFNLRPSLIWRDGEWIEWSSSGENNRSSHGGDTPQEKRPRVRSPAVEPKGKDKASKSIDVMESDKSDDPTLLDLSNDEKLFNIGKSTKDENRPNALRMTRTGLQKEGSRGVIFGVPKPGKKRKFMEVSKHYVADGSSQINEASDSVKFTKYLIPQGGAGSRGWKSTAKTESNDKRAAVSKPKVLKSGKPQNVSGRTIPQKDNLSSSAVSAPDDSTITDHITRTKDSVNRIENTSEKQNLMGFQTFPSSDGATEGPILFSALALPSDTVSSKKMPTSNAKPERVSKGKLAPAGGKLSKIEEGKPLNGSSAKSTSDPVEPRRSNRRIQPTSRLLEGLQSSLMVSKIPSVSHDKSHRSRNASKGNNHG